MGVVECPACNGNGYKGVFGMGEECPVCKWIGVVSEKFAAPYLIQKEMFNYLIKAVFIILGVVIIIGGIMSCVDHVFK